MAWFRSGRRRSGTQPLKQSVGGLAPWIGFGWVASRKQVKERTSGRVGEGNMASNSWGDVRGRIFELSK